MSDEKDNSEDKKIIALRPAFEPDRPENGPAPGADNESGDPDYDDIRQVMARADEKTMEAVSDFRAYLKASLEQLNFSHAVIRQNATDEQKDRMGAMQGVYISLLCQMKRGVWEYLVEQHRDHLRRRNLPKLAQIFRRADKHGAHYFATGEAKTADVIRNTDEAVAISLVTCFRSYHALRAKLQDAFPDLDFQPAVAETGEDDIVYPAIHVFVKKGVDRDIRDIIKDYIEQDKKPGPGLRVIPGGADQPSGKPR